MSPNVALGRAKEDTETEQSENTTETLTLHKLAIELNQELIVMQGKVATLCEKLATLEQ